jgi:hypothetical protein
LEFLMTERHRPDLRPNSASPWPPSPPDPGARIALTTNAPAPQARRRFFKVALCAPALAVAATAAPAAATPLAAAPAAMPPKQSNYHETEHIRTYYDLAAY